MWCCDRIGCIPTEEFYGELTPSSTASTACTLSGRLFAMPLVLVGSVPMVSSFLYVGCWYVCDKRRRRVVAVLQFMEPLAFTSWVAWLFTSGTIAVQMLLWLVLSCRLQL